MKNHALWSTIVAALVLFGFAGDRVSGVAAPKKKKAPPKRSSECLCPVYPWAFHGSYTSYYAIRCSDSAPVNLDAANNLSNTSCQGEDCFDDCVLVPASKKLIQKKRGQSMARAVGIYAGDSEKSHAYVQTIKHDGSDGIGRRGGAIYWDDELPSTPGRRPFKNVLLRVRLPGGDDFKIKLLAYKVKPPNYAEKVFVIGVHVQKGTPNVEIPSSSVMLSSSRRVCAIRYDFQDNAISTTWHPVMCHKDRELPESK